MIGNSLNLCDFYLYDIYEFLDCVLYDVLNKGGYFMRFLFVLFIKFILLSFIVFGVVIS